MDDLFLRDPEERKRHRFIARGDYEEVKKNHDIRSYIRSQLEIFNFEPAAKYLYSYFIDGCFSTFPLTRRKLSPGDITFDEVYEALGTAPAALIPPETRNAIDLFYKGYQFLEKHSREE